jgi:hypothetical protein
MEPDPDEKSPYNAAVRAHARDLLGYMHKSGGTAPGGFTIRLFELWTSADRDNKAIIAVALPFMGVVSRANDEGGEAAVREVAGI